MTRSPEPTQSAPGSEPPIVGFVTTRRRFLTVTGMAAAGVAAVACGRGGRTSSSDDTEVNRSTTTVTAAADEEAEPGERGTTASMVAISGRARLLDAELDGAMRAASAMATASRADPGCVAYRFSVDVEDALVLQLTEHWESPAALDAHFATPHFATFAEALGRAVDGTADFTRYDVLSAGPLFG